MVGTNRKIGSWIARHAVHILFLAISVNMIIGTFLLLHLEPAISLSDAAYVHFSSFTTLGSSLQIINDYARTYLIMDALAGYLFIPTLAAILAIWISGRSLERSTETFLRRDKDVPKRKARKMAKAVFPAVEIVTSDTLSEDQKGKLLKDLIAKMKQISEEQS